MTVRTFFFGAIFAASVLIPAPAHAQLFNFTGTVVPEECRCEQVIAPQVPGESGTNVVSSAPAYGCVLQTVQNVVRFAIALGFVVALFAIMYAGFVWMTSGANAEKRTQGRNVLLGTILGIFIMLGAWLIVDFVMKTLYKEPTEFGPWNNILAANGASACITPTQPRSLASGTLDLIRERTGGQSSGGTIQGTQGCPTCVPLTGIACKSQNSCTADPAYASRLTRLAQTFRGNWVVTEAFPPTYNHSNQCHNRGTCVDAAFRGETQYTAENVAAFAQAATNAGLRAVFETNETGSCPLRDAARARGVSAYCKADAAYRHVTGTHFSLYSN